MSDQDPIATVWEIFQPPAGSRIAWMHRAPEVVGGGLDSLASLRAFAARYRKDCYFTPNPVVGEFGKRPSTIHVAYIRFVVIDLDPVQTAISVGSRETITSRMGPSDVDNVARMVRCNDERPTVRNEYVASSQLQTIERRVISHAESLLGFQINPDRIDSGRGRQLWLRFEPTPVPTQEEKSRWRAAVGAFLHRLDQDLGRDGDWRVDTSCCDLPRLVRLPGTRNSKTDRLAGITSRGDSDSRIHSAILDRFGVSPTPSIRPSGGDWRSSFHLLSARAKRFISGGESEPGRHSGAYAAASSLKDVGASYAITEGLVLKGAGRCSPPLPEYEARRAVRNAFKEEQLGA